MRIYAFSDYKAFVLERISSSPRGGRGLYRRIAENLRVHVSFLTQVFSGHKNLSLEQGYLLADFLGLDAAEKRYFSLLIQLARAGRPEYRDYLRSELEKARPDSLSSGEEAGGLDPAARTIFYSAWYYSAVHLMTTLPEQASARSIAKRLELSPSLVQGVLDFLVLSGLCEMKDGCYTAKVNATIEIDSRLAASHRMNWRQRSLDRVPRKRERDLFHTSVVSMAREDHARVHALIEEMIAKSAAIVRDSPSETLYCMNVDWFSVLDEED